MLEVSRSAQVVDFYYAGDLDKCRSNYRVCLYLVAGTGELALYFTNYSGSVDDRSRVHDSDRGCKGAIWLQSLMDD